MINFKQHEENFEIIDKVGAGGYGSVYKVKNKLDGNVYALKKIKLESEGGYQNEETTKVLKECRYLSRLDHPNILRYYGSWIHYRDHERMVDQLESPGAGQRTSVTKNFESFALRLRNDISLDKISPVATQKTYEIQVHSDEKSRQKASIEKDGDILNDIHRIMADDVGRSGENDQDGSSDGDSFEGTTKHNGRKENLLYIQTEYCDMNLEQYLNERGRLIRKCQKMEMANGAESAKKNDMEVNPFLVYEAFAIGFQLIKALKYIHNKQNVIHRDLKPTNIFMNLKSRSCLIKSLPTELN